MTPHSTRLNKHRTKLFFFFGVPIFFLLLFGYTFFLIPRKQTAPLLCSGSVICAEKKILSVLESKGIDAAFDELNMFYNSDKTVAFNCHYFTHLIGTQAYYKYKNHENFTLTPKTSYCGYGFYHGFMETLLKETSNIKEAHDFCLLADKSLSNYTRKPSVACFHGIGHGAVDGTDLKAWGNAQLLLAPALKICSRLNDNNEKYLCASGAFNSLAIAYNTKKFGLIFDKTNPYKDCVAQKNYEFMHACYEEMNTAALNSSNGNFKEALIFATKIPSDTYASIAAENIAAAYAQMLNSDEDYKHAASICQQTEERLVKNCIAGVEGGIIEFGPPEKEYEKAVFFCNNTFFTKQNKDYCFSRLYAQISQLYTKDKTKKICSSFPKEYHNLCAT